MNSYLRLTEVDNVWRFGAIVFWRCISSSLWSFYCFACFREISWWLISKCSVFIFLVKGCADIVDIIYSSLILQFVKGTCFTNLLSPTSSLYCLSYRKTLKFDSYLNLLLGKVFQWFLLFCRISLVIFLFIQ